MVQYSLLTIHQARSLIDHSRLKITSYMKVFVYTTVLAVLLSACGARIKVDPALATDADLLNRNEKELTQVIIYDVFTPPVASRIYAYTSLASYEAIRFQNPSYQSIVSQMHGFG